MFSTPNATPTTSRPSSRMASRSRSRMENLLESLMDEEDLLYAKKQKRTLYDLSGIIVHHGTGSFLASCD